MKKKKTLLGGSTRDDRGKIQVFAFEGDRSLQQRGDGGATAELDSDSTAMEQVEEGRSKQVLQDLGND